MKRLYAALLCTALLCGCADSTAAPDGPAASISVEADEVSAVDTAAMADFALALLRQQQPGKQNTLISPLSILAALGMTANGADGETLEQMEEVFGLTANRLCAIMPGLLAGNDALHLANGIWYRDAGMTVYPEFLAACADYYNATAKPTSMDATTREEINAFIEEHTESMIPDMLAEGAIDPHIVMLLVNALAFEAEWTVEYLLYQNTSEPFAGVDGTVTYMGSTERRYLEGRNATGFIKPYRGDRYAFAAILPNKGVTLDDYLADLDGAALVDLLNSATDATVMARLPKFSCDYDADLAASLSAIGMPAAFDGALADFTRLGTAVEGNIFIEKVMHRTHISVGEKGTEAAASTVVVAVPETAMVIPADAKYVYLTRPFLYMIVDLDTALPVFIGTVTDPR